MNAAPRYTIVATALLLALCCCRTVAAQQPGSDFAVRKNQQAISPDEIVRRFEAPQLVSYSLGDGDEISVDVWSHPELSGRHVIGPDGKITLPIAGIMKVSDLTREEAQNAISASFARFYSDLLVTVRVDRYTSYRVFVLGRPGSPGVLQFDSQPTLLDVITRTSSTASISATDKAGLGRCAILRGRDQMIWVDLKSLLTEGSMALNIRLERNDLVYMPDASEQVVYVLGEVKHPGAYPLTPAMSFLDALSQAGGATVDASNAKIEIIHSVSGVQRELDFKDLLNHPQQLNFALAEGDILYVPRRNLAKFGYVLQQTASLAGFAVLSSVGAK